MPPMSGAELRHQEKLRKQVLPLGCRKKQVKIMQPLCCIFLVRGISDFNAKAMISKNPPLRPQNRCNSDEGCTAFLRSSGIS